MDYLVSVLIWIMAVYGMTTIIVNSTIMHPVRKFITAFCPPLGKLVDCMLCMAFWCGMFWGAVYWHPFAQSEEYYRDSHYLLDCLFAGCFGSATTWLIYLKAFPLMQGK